MTYKTIHTEIKNRYGLTLSTDIYKPSGDGQFSAVIILHGFTGYKEEVNLADLADRLSTDGIITVRFTASGFGDSGGTLADDYRFSNYRADAQSVYEYVRQLSYCDSTRIGVFGHSMGGKLAVLIAADHRDIRALCIVSAPTQFFSTSYADMKDDWYTTGYFEKVSSRDKAKIRVPAAYLDDVDDQVNDVCAAADLVSCPSLVIAGTEDTVVPWRDTKRIYEKLHGRKQFLLLDDIGHYYKRDAKLLPVVHKPVVTFFCTEL